MQQWTNSKTVANYDAFIQSWFYQLHWQHHLWQLNSRLQLQRHETGQSVESTATGVIKKHQHSKCLVCGNQCSTCFKNSQFVVSMQIKASCQSGHEGAVWKFWCQQHKRILCLVTGTRGITSVLAMKYVQTHGWCKVECHWIQGKHAMSWT